MLKKNEARIMRSRLSPSLQLLQYDSPLWKWISKKGKKKQARIIRSWLVWKTRIIPYFLASNVPFSIFVFGNYKFLTIHTDFFPLLFIQLSSFLTKNILFPPLGARLSFSILEHSVRENRDEEELSNAKYPDWSSFWRPNYAFPMEKGKE